MSNQLVEVAIAIIHRQNQFLMQLRDNIPGIIYPGCWGFFGGHLDPGETPEVAMKRELLEEIGYTPPKVLEFGNYVDAQVIRHVYQVPLTVELDQLVLNEGWDMDLFTPEEVRKGERYSVKAKEVRPLGRPHQQILLDFIES
ncbi:MAG: NUDIX hydrolase [Kastovskya adunca ATA6-11-RM4]|jgi:8-oxo-dGTP pyrophosphatase MutT (NUDIX family)|nr:NUDIX hydrolase [Kastovskya adunca ATA6-11-RM4]